MDRNARKCKIIFASVGLFLFASVMIIAFVVPSIRYVSYNEYAMKQNKFGEVDLQTVYTQGRYVISFMYNLVKLPSTMQKINVTSTVFSNLGLEFDIHIEVYYQLPIENLGEIYHQFSLNYENRITNIIKTTVKDIATSFNVDDYVINRTEVERTFSNDVHQKLQESIGVDIPVLYFRMLDIIFPQSVVDSSLASAIEIQTNQIRNYEQQVAVIEADTNNQVAAINIQTNLTLATAMIESNQIITNSISQANSIVLAARAQGIQYVMNLLNITTPEMQSEFIRLTSILDGINPKIFSGNFNILANV